MTTDLVINCFQQNNKPLCGKPIVGAAPSTMAEVVKPDGKLQAIDLQLERLLNLSVTGAISAQEYREKKAHLINAKFELQQGGGSDGKWLEHLKNFVTLAHQATYIALGGNYETQRDYLKIFGSNLKLAGATLLFSYRYPYKFFAERTNNNMGWVTGFELAA